MKRKWDESTPEDDEEKSTNVDHTDIDVASDDSEESDNEQIESAHVTTPADDNRNKRKKLMNVNEDDEDDEEDYDDDDEEEEEEEEEDDEEDDEDEDGDEKKQKSSAEDALSLNNMNQKRNSITSSRAEDEEEEEEDDEEAALEDEGQISAPSHPLVKKSHHEVDDDSVQLASPGTGSQGVGAASKMVTDVKMLSSKEKARLKRQQILDETIDKLLSKSRELKNAQDSMRNRKKCVRPYEPYSKKGVPVARMVYTPGGDSYLIVPEDVTLFPPRPVHVKRTKTQTE